MKTIQLTQGYEVVVDDEDCDELNKYKWHVLKKKHLIYARRQSPRVNGVQHTILMHRIILPNCIEVDHIDGNGLNNVRSNLRPADCSDNAHNRRKQLLNTSSIYKGVSLHRDGKFQASIGYVNRRIYIGLFTGEVEAAKAYDRAAIELYGIFASLNFSS